MTDDRPYRTSARWRLTLSYAGFLLLASSATLVGIYVVLRLVPNYPLLAPGNGPAGMGGSRGEILASVVRASLVVLGVLAVIGLAGGWWLAGRVLRPLDELRRGVRTVADGRLDHRIRLRGPRDEFAEVADGFDRMLDRLQSAFAAQERFAANAAHELRTPLTVQRTLLDVALLAPDADPRPTLDRLSTTTDRAIELTEALLRLADANELSALREPVDVAELIADAVRTVSDEAAERGIMIDAEAVPGTVIGDGTLLRQMLVNLFQNGVRHNRDEGALRLRSTVAAGELRIVVENDGAAIPADRVATLTEPLLRGAGRTARAAGERRGHGLGLALVDRIVAVHRGTLDLAPRSSGGLSVRVVLPLAPPGGAERPGSRSGGRAPDAAVARAAADALGDPPRRRAPDWLLPLALVAVALAVLVTGLLLAWDGVTIPLR